MKMKLIRNIIKVLFVVFFMNIGSAIADAPPPPPDHGPGTGGGGPQVGGGVPVGEGILLLSLFGAAYGAIKLKRRE